MAFTYLVIEDGTGLVNSNTYVGTGYSNSYHTRRGNTGWTGSDVQAQEVALMNATYAIDARYGAWYKGELKTSEQALLFPRTPFIDKNGRPVKDTVPSELMDAVCEFALQFINGTDLFIDPAVAETGVKSFSNTAGPVSESVTYFAPKGSTTYSTGLTILRPILTGTPNGFQGTAIRG